MMNSFILKNSDKLQNKYLLLLDDIVTASSTLGLLHKNHEKLKA
jgi:predicted amidophosphoribosyltransferase